MFVRNQSMIVNYKKIIKIMYIAYSLRHGDVIIEEISGQNACVF